MDNFDKVAVEKSNENHDEQKLNNEDDITVLYADLFAEIVNATKNIKEPISNPYGTNILLRQVKQTVNQFLQIIQEDIEPVLHKTQLKILSNDTLGHIEWRTNAMGETKHPAVEILIIISAHVENLERLLDKPLDLNNIKDSFSARCNAYSQWLRYLQWQLTTHEKYAGFNIDYAQYKVLANTILKFCEIFKKIQLNTTVNDKISERHEFLVYVIRKVLLQQLNSFCEIQSITAEQLQEKCQKTIAEGNALQQALDYIKKEMPADWDMQNKNCPYHALYYLSEAMKCFQGILYKESRLEVSAKQIKNIGPIIEAVKRQIVKNNGWSPCIVEQLDIACKSELLPSDKNDSMRAAHTPGKTLWQRILIPK